MDLLTAWVPSFFKWMNISTDETAGSARVLAYRSNIPKIGEFG
jgi:hypothetical protein